MGAPISQRILDRLVESFGISEEDLAEARLLKREEDISLERALIRKGIVSEDDLMVLLVKELHVPFIHLNKYRFDPALKAVISREVALRYKILPLSRLQKTLTVAFSDPLNILAVDDLKHITGCEIDVVMSPETEILDAIEKFYGSEGTGTLQELSRDIAQEGLEIVTASGEDETAELSADEGEQAPVIRMVNLIIQEAIRQRASDIHIEPMADKVRVRYRIDGVLQEILRIPKENQNAVIVRIKIMARLDITATRVPQDGRFKMRVAGQEVDFRVSLLPTIFGQKIVLRILDKKNLRIGLDGLGFSPRSVGLLKEAIRQPFGMILVTGPTGSGKSTTLYSIINELNTVDKNIITVEDPVEYLIEGLTQIQVRPEIGLTFASGLKAILRQSPDIVMVGEIRDGETADIAIKASLTGQLVFSTLHTNDAAGALTRLVDMGVEPFLVASSLVCVCAQRLCRRICTRCRTEADIPEAAWERLGWRPSRGQVFYTGAGCASCRDTGYWGRVGVTEVLMVDEAVREMLIRGCSSDEIRDRACREKGMVLLWDDILDRFRKGETTLEEVLRVTSGEV